MPLALLLWVLAAAVVFLFVRKLWWFPPPISQHAASFDHQFTLTLLITGAAFLLAQLALGAIILRFRANGRRAAHTHGSNRLELLWTALTALFFMGLAAAGTIVFTRVQFAPTPPDAIRIEVAAKQFAWSFRYPGPDRAFGRTDIRLVNDASGNPFGIDEKDPAGKDDVVTAAVRVPAGKPVLLILKSRDVIHNFFVRELRIKQDVVPGMDIPLLLTADKPGSYEVACSELCGLGHHQMRTSFIVLPPDEFEDWLRSQASQ